MTPLIKIHFEFLDALHNKFVASSNKFCVASIFNELDCDYVKELIDPESGYAIPLPPYLAVKDLKGYLQSLQPQARVTVMTDKLD